MTAAAPSFKVIYNDCYGGGFLFSTAFEAEYRKRTGWDLMTEKRLFRNGPDSVRRDPVAIALLEEKGAEWSSGENSFLAIRTIPAQFEKYWSIEEYDGNESVYVNTHEAYADILHAYMADGNLAALTDGYRRLRTAVRALTEAEGYLAPGEVITAPTVSATTSDVRSSTGTDSSTGYGFFDSGVISTGDTPADD